MTAQPQKRGAKGYYTGSRLTFLEGYCDQYISLRGKSRHQFWHEFFTAWWEKYPWRLPDHEEPPADDPKKMEALARVGVDEDAKSDVELKVREVSLLVKSFDLPRMIELTLIPQRITSWFSYRASVQNSHRQGGAWTPLLKHVFQQLKPKPHCRSAFQQLMHEEPMVVNASFVSKYGEGRGLDRGEQLNRRNEVARRLIATTYKDKVPELEERAKEFHERELKEWGLGLEAIEEAEDVTL
jgi:hypothetical protein